MLSLKTTTTTTTTTTNDNNNNNNSNVYLTIFFLSGYIQHPHKMTPLAKTNDTLLVFVVCHVMCVFVAGGIGDKLYHLT